MRQQRENLANLCADPPSPLFLESSTHHKRGRGEGRLACKDWSERHGAGLMKRAFLTPSHPCEFGTGLMRFLCGWMLRSQCGLAPVSRCALYKRADGPVLSLIFSPTSIDWAGGLSAPWLHRAFPFLSFLFGNENETAALCRREWKCNTEEMQQWG